MVNCCTILEASENESKHDAPRGVSSHIGRSGRDLAHGVQAHARVRRYERALSSGARVAHSYRRLCGPESESEGNVLWLPAVQVSRRRHVRCVRRRARPSQSPRPLRKVGCEARVMNCEVTRHEAGHHHTRWRATTRRRGVTRIGPRPCFAATSFGRMEDSGASCLTLRPLAG